MSVINLVTDPAPPQLVFRPIDTLAVYAKNARTHSRAQLEQLARSIDAFGWTNAVLADDAGIVAGHGRVEAAKLLYKQGKVLHFPNGAKIPEGMVPVVPCDGWDDDKRRAYILADNRLALDAGWDMDILRDEVLVLQGEGFDLDLLGFSDQELHDLLEVPELAPEADPDAVPDVPEDPHSQPGDIWVMGPHRVICGSSLEIDTWDALMAGERADLAWTDPPYNVDVGRKNRLMDTVDGGGRAKSGAIKNDKMSAAEFGEFLRDAYLGLFSALKPGSPVYVAHSDTAGGQFRQEFEAAGFHFSQTVIWRKNVHVLGLADFQPIHEPILYGWKPGAKHRWYGGRKRTTVVDLGEGGPITRLPDGRWQIAVGDAVMIVDGQATVEQHPSGMIHEAKPPASKLHPTQKPVALVERLLRHSGRRGDLVVDGFGGSGSTLIAADQAGMEARLVELDPKFVDVIVRRWQDFTGRRAVHAVSGQPFPEPPKGA